MKKSVFVGLAVLFLVLTFSRTTAADSPGRIIDAFYDAYSRGAVDEMLSFFAPHAVFEDVNQRHRFEGTESLRELFVGLVQMHERMEVSEKRRLVQGNVVVVEYDYRGTLDGVALSQISGKECSSIEYTLPATTWFTIEDGRIVHQKDFIDLATLKELQLQVAGGVTSSNDDAAHH